MITVLAGGVGAARFLTGLLELVDPNDVTVIVNTGDDVILHGLYISPDIDTITYTLSGLSNNAQGWGLKDETWECLGALNRLGHQTWFKLGDRDIALHIHRTQRMSDGKSLAEVTDEVAKVLGLKCHILPMSNQRVETRIETDCGMLGFQEYLVKNQARDRIKSVKFSGIDTAYATEGVIEAITHSDAIIIAPSNPIISIGPILAIKSIRESLYNAKSKVIAISPIVGGMAIKGPASEMMTDLGHESSALGIAKIYKPFLDSFVIDNTDSDLLESINSLDIKTLTTNTIMDSLNNKIALAQFVLKALEMDQN